MPARTGKVHVATTKRTYQGKVYCTHLLRRSFRQDGKVKHETLGNISHLPDYLIDLIARSLNGETFVSADQALCVNQCWPHGHVEAILGMIRKLELDKMIYSKRTRQRDLVLALIVERIIHPGSKLATVRLWEQTTLAEELSLQDTDVDEVYQVLDWLLGRQGAIEKQLAARHLREGGRALYDTSSSSYEGRHCSLAQFGYNRDGRKDLPSIVYGVLTDEAGRPIAVEVYPGNTADPTTVPTQVDQLRQEFGLEKVVLVGDRGLLTKTQLNTLRQHPGLGWITALRAPQIRQLVEQNTLQLSLFDQRNLAEIQSPDYPGERLVACFNPILAEERRRKRQDLLAATERELEAVSGLVKKRRKPLSAQAIGIKVGRVINRYKMAKHFQLELAEGKFSFQRKQESIAREEALDGIYVLRTSEPQPALPTESVVRSYKTLSDVERAFRCLKGMDLRIRPIYHRLEDHVRAHIFLCLLAYYVEWHLRQAWAPLLFEEEHLAEYRQQRDPVATAKPSPLAQSKKASRQNGDGLPLHSFNTLLQALATRCRVCYGLDPKQDFSFRQISLSTPLQQRALDLIRL